ncbi:MAG: hypothetical protein QGH42_04245 [Kiritimatiellia bacterium]|jgi:phenylacetate-CoA ligase|nr:hypothetical protein [Kiritimatiellia bacterium]
MNANLFWRGITPLTYALRGNRGYTYLMEMAARRAWTREQWEALQLEKLRALLQHCQAEVPYYRDLFREVGFEAREVQSVRDLEVLPVLTKDIVKVHGGRMIADNMRSRLRVHHTGGSTGVPLSFYRHRECEELGFAGVLRNFQGCGWTVGEPIAEFWGFQDSLNDMSRTKVLAKSMFSRFYHFNAFDLSEANSRVWLASLRRIRPTVISGYASTIYLFARHLKDAGVSLTGVKGIFTTAEPLFDFQRECIEEVCGAKLYNAYGSTEVLDVACECRCGSIHQRLDAAVVEFDASRVDTGYEMIQTSLNNYAMPYIRYRNEDLAEAVDGMCECGDSTPLMSAPSGRTFGNMTTPSGRVVHGQFFVKLLYDLCGVHQFQFHQTGTHEMVLRIVKSEAFEHTTTEHIDRAMERTREILGGDMDVRLEYMTEIPVTSRGKFLYTKNDTLEIS